MNVLGIAGSLRRRSFNRSLLHAAATFAPAHMTIRVYDDLAAIPSFNEDLEDATDGGPAAVRELRRMVGEADGVIIATPEYNHSVPGVLKNALDWLSRANPEAILEAKPVAVVGASGGSWGTRLAQSAVRQVLYATESAVLPAPALFVRDAASAFDGSGRLVDPRTEEQLRRVLIAFGEWIQLVSRTRHSLRT